MHRSLESSNMIERVTRSIIRVQERHLELWRQGVTVDGSREGGVCSMNQILYRIRPSHVLPHLVHDLLHLIHLLLQVWHPSWNGTLWLALGLSFSSSSSWLWACPSTYPSWRFLLRLISLVNSWFWWINSAMAVAMDCMCWMENCCMTSADWWSW